ncbi:elongation of very long chain fatty acids protein-like [Pieris napi]|uniref:elongation of very long chain fatty acids protein-like n=1 Tax=Pieris napi TaxID=78633 RepID=UPI001FBADCE3|nr:elongation of very long chain fatty acids protein-like [Pieris napi]XP_047516268.1 elongation of very long chain fatty acids protein-like [Pieris napi]
MTSVFGLRFPEWDLTKSQFKELDELPLMRTPGPILMILAAYLLFVLKVGPALMTKREPYKLTAVLVLYNFFQVVLSAFMVYRYATMMSEYGIAPTTCHMHDKSTRETILLDIWIYFAAKVTELLDTIFFVLRKKDSQVTFLHLYHHSVMMIGTWMYLKYWPSYTLFFIGFMNALVHVFMYTYYGLAALGPKVTKYIFWKKYMTKFQLLQFFCIIAHYIVAVNKTECPPTKGVAIFIGGNTLFFAFLFLNFYFQNYRSRNLVKDKTLEKLNRPKVIGDANNEKEE